MIHTPRLSKVNNVLIFGIALIAALYFGRSFFIPFTFAIVLSMLVLPICKKLESWGWSRGWAVAVSILVIILAGILLIGIMAAPIASFQQDLPQLKESLQKQYEQLQQFVAQKTNQQLPPMQEVMKKASSGVKSGGKAAMGLLGGLIGFLAEVLLMLVYMVFFLSKREKYENFVVKLNKESDEEEVRRTLHEISNVSAQYLLGRFLSIIILAILYTIGLTALGVKHAVVLSGIAAVLTLIPFVGTTLGGVFPAAAAFLSGSGTSPLAVIGVVFLVQLLDEYFLTPFIIGNKVDTSPLAIIVAVVIGGIIWGVAGMFLFIPLFGMAKIVFDHIPALQPYGYLIGSEGNDENKYVQKIKSWFKQKFSKS